MRLTLRVFFLLLGWTAFRPIQVAWAQGICANPGKDGLGAISANPNTYYPGTATATAGSTSITVGAVRSATTPAIAAGDLLLVIQMQAADISATNDLAYGDGVAGGAGNGYLNNANFTAGRYEYVVAAGPVTSGIISLSTATPLVNTYLYANSVSAAGSAATGLRTFQVIRVPQYTTLTLSTSISPPYWNGSTGGITAIDVRDNMNFNGNTINATGLGFRGGAGFTQTYNSANGITQYLTTAALGLNGMKGEGIAGTPQYVAELGGTARVDAGVDGYPGGSASRGAPGNAGGGGNDNGNNSGGSGGGNGAAGGRGGNSSNNPTSPNIIGGEAGAPFAQISSNRLVMGGGGGAGTTNDGSSATANTGSGFASSGAPGGGIVIVRTGTVSGTGGISANGVSAAGVRNDGAGGGGAGGSILLTAAGSQSGLANLTLSAIGGNGGIARPVDVGNGSTAHGPGGGGGGGVILATGPVASAATTGGANGTSTPGSTVGTAAAPYGAVAGTTSTGTANNSSISNTIANSTSGAICASSITGYVYEDANYGGGSGRSRATLGAGAVSRPGAIVELYNSAGTFISSTVTDANGQYTLPAIINTSYTVRVLNSSVTSNRTGATFTGNATSGYTSTQVAVQTYNGTTTRVGGEAPSKVDAAAGTTGTTLAALNTATAIAQSQLTLTTATSGNTTGPDFGFNFDVVVNTNDAGQGSLRQFITNANALGGENLLAQAGSNAAGAIPTGTETSIFMIPNGTARPGLLASGSGGPASQLNGSGVAVISPASVLPTLTGANTSLDATTQTFNIGNSNAGVLGTGGTVGTAATAFPTVNRPEVQLVGTRTFDGVVVGATTTTVRGFSLYGFDHNITVNNDITAFLIEQNVVGTSATSFTDPGVGVRTLNEGILLNNADNGTVRNNLSGFNGGMGVWVQGFGNGSNGNLISNNEIRGNGQESKPAPEGLVFDGMELQGASTNNTVSGNLITANYGHGIDSFGNGIGGNTVSGNTISNNGVGVATGTGEEGSGLRLFSATNLTRITNNVLSGNNGSGVLVSGSGNNITISQNSTFGNTRLGIDLISETNAPVFYNGNTSSTPNVTLNDSGDGDTGGNGLLNYPVITRATLTANGLLVQGFARPGSAIELFAADNTANSVAANADFGQGRTYLGTFTEGSTTGTSPDTDAGTGTYGPGTVNGLNQGTDNTNAFSFLIPLTGNFAGLPAGTTLTSTATLNNSTSEFSGNATLSALSGYVYEDVNYGGGAGRPRSASGTAGRSGATVELYSGTTLVGTTTTDANGQYTFSTTPGTYTVRVVNSTVSSSRTGYVAGLLPVQTYNGTTTAVGGADPTLTDAPANSGSQSLGALTSGTVTPQSIATITTTNAATAGPDFGFNFDVVVNTNDAGQGSLRQFITNANALGGENLLAQAGSYTNAVNLATGSAAAGRAGVALPAGLESSIFMIPATRLTNGVAVITPASALPQLTGPNTAINGATQTFNIGNTNDVLLGNGGTVGTQATALSQLNGPEVQLVGNTGVAFGLDVNASATNTRIRGLAIYGFGNAPDNDAGANIRSAANSLIISQNVLGTTATSFTAPATLTNADNVRLIGGTSSISVTGNLIGYSNSKGVSINGGVTNVSITGNEIRSNGLGGANFDGIDINGSSATVTGNLLTGTSGQGVDSYRSTGSNVITGNTITDNGRGTTIIAPNETPGTRIYGANNRLAQNIIANNYGAGIMLEGTNATATSTVMSQNSIYGNGNVAARNGAAATSQVGIDLQANGNNEAAGNSPYVTLNSATTTGANGLLNYPVITSATLVGSNLVVSGYAKAGATIELFTAQPNPAGVNATGANFGQGRTYLTTVTEGTNDADARTGLSYSGNINGFNQGSDTNANGFTFTIPLSSLPGGTLAGGTLLTSTATLGGATSEFSGNAAAVVIAPLTGYVYEDVNYGGGAGRSRATLGAAAIGRPGAKVELYDANNALVGTAITDANGQYSFNAAVGTGYTVRVVNNSVLSSRTGASAASGTAAAGYVSNQLAVQTYNGTTTRVGGENPALVDAAANTGTQTLTALTSTGVLPQSIATISVGTGATNAGPDFGYNFDVVVNTNDAGQGSLRQFISNANALGGENLLAQAGSNSNGALPAGRETSIFMIPNGQLTSGVAVITPASALPAITGALTSIDGTTQTINIGNTNNATLGTGGTVGTSNTVLGQLNGPEVQLKGSNSFDGLSLTANNTTVRGLSLYGFADNIVGGSNNTGTLIEQNVIGASATSFTDPGGTNRTLNEGIDLNGSDNGIVRNNLIGFNGGMGIWVANSFADANNGANGNTISNNEVRSNALLTNAGNGERLVYDGIELQGSSTGNTVSGNLITANTGHGIDSFDNTIGGNTIIGNTISNNGVGVANNTGEEGSGLRVLGATNPTTISGNVLSGNNGSGVLVVGSANQVTISQNSTFNNTRLGIDLLADNNPPAFYNGNTGSTPNVTLNDSGDGDTGGNGLLNYPVLTTATLSATTLTVTGYARPGSLVELFLSTPLGTDPTASNRYFGQGSSFLAGRTEGVTADDSNTGTGTYGTANINGVAQGTDNTNLFTFSIPLSSLTPAQRTALSNTSALLTATATIARSTSEFSANTRVLQAPVPNDVTNVTVADNQAAPVVLNPNVSATAIGFTGDITTNTANTIASYVVTPIATGGALFYNGTAVTAATTVPAANIGQLTFLPTRGFTGNASFTYTAIDANGTTSTTHSTSGTITNGPATYTFPVAAAADVTASLTGSTTLSPGQPTGYYTATFTNLGPDAASSVTRVVTLPTGASLTSAQQNAITTAYPTTTVATTGSGTSAITTITFPPATTLASGAANSYRFAFTAPTTAGSSTLVASTSTTSSEGANVAANSASLTLTTTPVVDVQATLAVTGAATVAPGATATFTATFTNNGTPSAAGVVPTVQLIPGLTTTTLTVGGQTGTLSGTTITFAGGATYSTTTGQITYPTAALAGGASLSSVIAFTMPGSGVVTGTAAVTTTTTDSNPANNVNSASITAGPRFDLATTISGPTSVVAGAPVTLNVTTTNNGPQAIAGAVLTVQLPSGLNPSAGSPGVFISNGGTYDNTSGVVTFPALSSLPSGQTVANTITFLSPTAAFTPSAQVTPNTTGAGDTNTANNTAYLNGAASSTATGATLTPTTATGTPANLVATLTTASTVVDAGTQVTYTVGATNAGPGAAASVTGRLQLLPGLNATTLLVNGLGGTLQADNVTYTFADGTAYKSVSYNSQTGLLSYAATATPLTSGTSFSFPVAVTVPTSVGNEGQLLATNSVGSASPESVPADNVQAATVTVRPRTDLATTLTGPTAGVVPGQSVTYTATFTNNGPSTARTTTETVQLPSGLTATTLTVGGQTGTLSGTTITFASGATYSTATGLATLPALASNVPGAVQTFNLTFVAPAQSYVVSSAISSATTDGTPANNAASVATAVTPTTDVAVSLAGPATAVIGNYATYTVTTTNNGPSTATNVAPTLQLPAGLTIQSAPAGYTYDNTTGLLVFPTISTLQAGVSTENYVTFTMPNATGGQFSALASVSSATLDNVATNNAAALTTSVAPATTNTPTAATTADLVTSITPASATVAPGSTVTYTATYRNAGTLAATNVTPTVSLPTGLPVSDLQVGGATGTLANGLITFGNSATYDVATGLLSFPTIASLAPSTTATSYSVAFSAPASGQLVVVSAVTSNTTDLNPGDNRSNSIVTVNSAFDLATSVSGPVAALAGSQNVYTIKTINNGPSSVSSATQTVQLPANLTTSTLLVAGQTGTLSGTTISYSNTGASYNTSSGLLTFAAISNLAPGAGNAVSNTITVTMPAAGSLTIGNAIVSTAVAGETNTNNNTATFTTNTAPLSFAPVARNVVNSLRSPEGNTANPLPISPLNATDADGSIASYAVQSLPTAGTLYYNGVAISSIPVGGYQVADASLLSYKPTGGFVGNAFFTYTATDNSGVVSNTGLYTLPVAQDQASAYTAYNTTKGGTTAYVTNDVLAQVVDPNKAVYTSAGTIFDTTTGVLQAGAANGLLTTGTNAALATSGPASNPTNTLPAGVSLDPATGRIFVSDASQLVNNPTARTYSVFVNTTDANGGITQALATFVLGAYPLPVVLTDFTAQAVQNRDAQLSWHTASEQNNDHFEVERSFDGTTFVKIGRVTGQGTTTSASVYAFNDANVAAQATGPVYYRLRQVDRNGTGTYSPLRTVSFTRVAVVKLTLFPNPVATRTNLDLGQLPATTSYQAQLLDATGRQVQIWTLLGGATHPLEIAGLASGSYLLIVTGQQPDGSVLKQTLRLTKE